MRFAQIVVILVFIASGCASHDSWTRKDTYRHAAMTGLMIIDWKQTRQIADSPNQYHEVNPILGNHPDKSEVDLYFASSWLVKTGVAYYLPAKYRSYWQYVCIGVSTGCVINNYSIGLRCDW